MTIPLGPIEPTSETASSASGAPVASVAPSPVILRSSENGSGVEETFYEQVGGHETFRRLVGAFYRGVAADPVLRPMYPEEDLGPAEERLTLFLEQYWGGPGTYSEQRGHPRLRMRHLPFKVNPEARDRWLTHMREAVDALDLPPLQHETLWSYLERAAHAMVNTFEE